jgi:hypothetical protein
MVRTVATFAITLATIAVVLASPARARNPTVITQCQKINNPGSYILESNLSTIGSSACLAVNANFVSIDLNGFTITGPGGGLGGAGTGIGISSGVESTTVKNGYVTNFGTCISLEDDGSAAVDSVKVSHCGTLGIQASGLVTNNIIQSGFGEAAVSTGLISNNAVLSPRTGIVVGAGSVVINNSIIKTPGVTEPGLTITCPSTIVNNAVVGFGSPGSPSGIVFTNGSKLCSLANNVTSGGPFPGVSRSAPLRPGQ